MPGVDPDAVIKNLGQKIGALSAQLAMTETALDAASRENDALRTKLAETENNEGDGLDVKLPPEPVDKWADGGDEPVEP